MNHMLAVAVGGAFGSVLRFGMSTALHQLIGRGFPVGTLLVNVVGSLLMGFLFIVLMDRDSVIRSGVLVGVLGGFTTFSAFSMETFHLIEQGAGLRAAAYVLISVVLCIGATWLGVLLARNL
jgi:fluoride exporter